MTRHPHRLSDPDERRTRIALAAIAGLFAGVGRTLTGWLLDHLTT